MILNCKFRRIDLYLFHFSRYGQFFGGDSYVILYTYQKNGSEEYVIYFWQGDESSQDEKGASALLAKELDDQLGDRPMQVRVTQGKEPPHFRQLFQGSLIIHKGGRASGFKNRADVDTTDTDGIALFHVRGTQPMNTCGIQVREVAASLNSADCFVLVTPASVYSWKGVGATSDEHTVATNIASILAGTYLGVGGRTLVQVDEGSEPPAFWDALGGKTEYASIRAGEPAPKDPRFFICSNATGTFKVCLLNLGVLIFCRLRRFRTTNKRILSMTMSLFWIALPLFLFGLAVKRMKLRKPKQCSMLNNLLPWQMMEEIQISQS